MCSFTQVSFTLLLSSSLKCVKEVQTCLPTSERWDHVRVLWSWVSVLALWARRISFWFWLWQDGSWLWARMCISRPVRYTHDKLLPFPLVRISSACSVLWTNGLSDVTESNVCQGRNCFCHCFHRLALRLEQISLCLAPVDAKGRNHCPLGKAVVGRGEPSASQVSWLPESRLVMVVDAANWVFSAQYLPSSLLSPFSAWNPALVG